MAPPRSSPPRAPVKECIALLSAVTMHAGGFVLVDLFLLAIDAGCNVGEEGRCSPCGPRGGEGSCSPQSEIAPASSHGFLFCIRKAQLCQKASYSLTSLLLRPRSSLQSSVVLARASVL
uniref:Uncharacterized protein n=1 Tax=Arundo donax TaxID=35708 RepID=A0A0A9B7E1_ARUDO